MAVEIKSRWARGAPLHVRNLFAWAPCPLFNSALVVDSDGTIHGSNAGMASACEALLEVTRVGSLDEPPSVAALTTQAAAMRSRIAEVLPTEIWESTLAVDRELTRFCRGLYGDYAAYRRRRRDVAGALSPPLPSRRPGLGLGASGPSGSSCTCPTAAQTAASSAPRPTG